MSQIEQGVPEDIQTRKKEATSFKEKWKATPKPVRKGIGRNLRRKKIELAASVTAGGLGVLGAVALPYVDHRYVHSTLLGDASTMPLPGMIPGFLISVLSGAHASDVKEKIDDYRKTAIRRITNSHKDWLINPPPKGEVTLFLRTGTPVKTPAQV